MNLVNSSLIYLLYRPEINFVTVHTVPTMCSKYQIAWNLRISFSAKCLPQKNVCMIRNSAIVYHNNIAVFRRTLQSNFYQRRDRSLTDMIILFMAEMSKTLGIVLILQYRRPKNWYWNWYWLCAFLRIGIGIGIVYTCSKKSVLELELFMPCLKNWYWIWHCLYND